MRILILTPYLPHRQVGHGGGTAVRDLVASLARLHEVLLVSLLRPGEENLIGEVEELGARVAGLPFLDRTATGTGRAALLTSRMVPLLRSFRTGFPHYVEKYHTPAIKRRLLELTASFRPDAVQIEYLQMSLYARDLRDWRREAGRPRPRLILNSHELGSIPRQRRAAGAGNPLDRLRYGREAAAWRRLQVAATGWADTTLCVTPEDQAAYADMGGRNLVTVPLGMDLESIGVDRKPSPPERVLFVGSFQHRPNRLAADFLIDQVWPTIRAERPQARLVIAGRGSDSFLARRNNAPAGVEGLGFVDDLSPLFRECAVFAAPLAEGGGIKIKILEAMARGIPVVTTSIGTEGITDAADGTLLISPCDHNFANALLGALADPEAGVERARRARDHMEQHFGWRAISGKLTRLYAGDSGPGGQVPED